MIKQEDSRQRQILTMLLNTPSGMSIDALADRLAISRTAVKQHLSSLEKLSLVREADLNSATGGRPARSYALTEQGLNSFPKQYAWFCNLLLDELALTLSGSELENLMWSLGVKLGRSLAAQFAGKSAAEKPAALVELMQSLGYHASLEPQSGLPGIKAVNCVYHDLAQKHPEICQFDLGLMSTLLERPVTQQACMAKRDCDCRFALGNAAERHGDAD